MLTTTDHIERGRRAIGIALARHLEVPDEWRERLRLLIEEEVSSWPWMLREWRRMSLIDWRRILAESVSSSNQRRERYARWMLYDVLLDPEYEEGQS